MYKRVRKFEHAHDSPDGAEAFEADKCNSNFVSNGIAGFTSLPEKTRMFDFAFFSSF